MTLAQNFYFPIFREIALSWNMTAASASNITTLLTASNDPKDPANRDGYTSNAACLIVGGAQESFYATPKNYTVVVKKRKGFVKLAMKSGKSIVPVISFNEVDIYDQVYAKPGSRLRKIQEWAKSYTNIAPIIPIGRGFFQYSFGWLPQRRPITTVSKCLHLFFMKYFL